MFYQDDEVIKTSAIQVKKIVTGLWTQQSMENLIKPTELKTFHANEFHLDLQHDI